MQCSNLLMRACIKGSGFKSDRVVKIAGVPQGCVLSPILFSFLIYKNEITCNGLTLIKYADDITLVTYSTYEHCLSTYRQYVETTVLWFQESSEKHFKKPHPGGEGRGTGRCLFFWALKSTDTCPSYNTEMGFTKRPHSPCFSWGGWNVSTSDRTF